MPSKRMTLRFRFFAQYREYLGLSESCLEVPAELTTVDELLAWICDHHSAWSAVVNAPDKLIALNRQLVKTNAPIAENDEIALLPPVTGG